MIRRCIARPRIQLPHIFRNLAFPDHAFLKFDPIAAVACSAVGNALRSKSRQARGYAHSEARSSFVTGARKRTSKVGLVFA